MRVLPSVLACDFSNLGSQILELSNSGIDGFHFDIMDGNFVPNFSFGPDLIKSVRCLTTLEFEIHLMINEPIRYIQKFCEIGSDLIIFHIESCTNTNECIDFIKKYGKKVGISLNPSSDIEKLFPYLKFIDLVLVMTVNPGFGGQKFMGNQILKIKKLRKKINQINKNIILEVDGGMDKETSKIVKNSGANSLVAGTFILNSKKFNESILFLKN